jgi:hypothetical protein
VPFTGLNNPTSVAVDSAGNLYVVDSGNSRVLKLTEGIYGMVTALSLGWARIGAHLSPP